MKIHLPKIHIRQSFAKFKQKNKEAPSQSNDSISIPNREIQRDNYGRDFSNTYINRDQTRQGYIATDSARTNKANTANQTDEHIARPYIEADPARNIGLIGDKRENSSQYLSNPLRDALEASGISKLTEKPSLQANINLSVDQENNVKFESENNETVTNLLTHMLSDKVKTIKHISSASDKTHQSLLIHDLDNGELGIKAVTQSKGDAVSVATYKTTLSAESFLKDEKSVLDINVPHTVIAQIKRNVFQNKNGELFRIENNQVYKLNTDQERWNPVNDNAEPTHKLVPSYKNGDIYQVTDSEIKSLNTGVSLNTDMHSGELKHIDGQGNMIGLNRDSQSGKHTLILGHIQQPAVRHIPVALSQNENILDVTQQDGNLFIISAGLDSAGEKEYNLYSLTLDNKQEQQATVNTPLKKLSLLDKSSTNYFSLAAFHHDSEGKVYIEFNKDKESYISPLASNDTPDVNLSNHAWVLKDAIAAEHKNGLPTPLIDRNVEFNTGEKLLLSEGTILYEDLTSKEHHSTSIRGEIAALETDGRGKKAYILADNQVQSLSIGVPTTKFNISRHTANNLSQGAATQVSATPYSGENIVAFAAAHEHLIVQLDNEGELTALEKGESKSLSEISALPDNSPIKQLAFDRAGDLVALGESGKIFKINAKELSQSLKDNHNHEEQVWHEIRLPINASAKAIHSGPEVKVEIYYNDQAETQDMSINRSELTSLKAPIKNNPYHDFAKRSNYGHIHEKKNKQGEKEVSLHKRQRILSRMGNYGAHIKDPFVRAPELLKQIKTDIKGTKSTREISNAAKQTHQDYQQLVSSLKHTNPAGSTFADVLKSLETRSPEAADSANLLYQELMKQLQDTLFQAGAERNVINPRTGNVQITNKHVGKEFGYGDRDLIQSIKKLLSHFQIDDQKKIYDLITAFEQSNQGLVSHSPILGSKQAHSNRSLQISKEHLELIAVTLNKLSEIIKQVDVNETADKTLTTQIEELSNSYKNNPVAKQNRLGMTSYEEVINMEKAKKDFAQSFDRANSAINRSMRAMCGTANREDTLSVMREVMNSMPKEAVVVLGQDVRFVPKIDFAWAIPFAKLIGKPLGISAFATVKGTLGLENKMVFSMMENGDLFISTNREVNKGLMVSAGIGATIGKLSKFFLPESAKNNASDSSNKNPLNLRPALRLNAWMDMVAMHGKEKGAILNIPAEERDNFLEKLFGGNATSQIKEILDTANKKTAVKATNFDANVNFSTQADVRGIVNADIGIDKINTLLRTQAELTASLNLVEVKYHDSYRVARGDIRHRVSDQVVHLIPEAYLQTQLRLLGAGEAYLNEATPGNGNTLLYGMFGESAKILYKRKVRPQDKKHEGTFNSNAGGIGEKVAHRVEKPINQLSEKITRNPKFNKVNKALRGVDNRRINRFDERIRATPDVKKSSYLDAIAELADSMKTQYPEAAKVIMDIHSEIKESENENFRAKASPIIQQATQLLTEFQKHGSFENMSEDISPLNNRQLSAINSLILLDAKKQAYDNGQYLQSKLRYTTMVTNLDRLTDPGTVNKLAAKIGLGTTVDTASHLAKLVQQSGDFKRIIHEEAERSWRTAPTATISHSVNATVRMTFHPDVQLRVDSLAARGLLSEQIIDDLQKGVGSIIKMVDGKPIVIPDPNSGKNNMIPFQIEITRDKARARDFETPLPLIRAGAKTNISTTTIATTINLGYESGKIDPTSISVERPIIQDLSEDLSKKLAIRSAKAAGIHISS
ncbi:AvrE-family type 3 secretion system effector [Agarilytica rhodophyticola]|uniref:AvrE-family type 3 secretion system effector n=1 Tax=Agarilytica rhodophyticola TaxID=1737490 RepID=UPI000B3414C8|nr:AvrE-family type 3 secretion system effector [Agarilytica rhodophyticola]